MLSTSDHLVVMARAANKKLRQATNGGLRVVHACWHQPFMEGFSFKDKEGKIRTEVRVRWWQADLSTYRKAAIVSPGNEETIPDLPLPEEWRLHPYSGPPVLFGHYWFTGAPAVISPRFACLDYSAAREGPLVAYRWDGEKELSSKKMAWVETIPANARALRQFSPLSD